ncbi:MAG: biotin synthase BioB [Thermoguttaceae bacterium]|jgi:biotin synthase
MKNSDSNFVEGLRDQVFTGRPTTREEALRLYDAPLEILAENADMIRQRFCGNDFDLCAIVNAKSGRCHENCKFCAQSSHYPTDCEVFPLISVDAMVEEAKRVWSKGVLRFSFVTSGRKISSEELDAICEAARRIRNETQLEVCGSLGLLTEQEFKRLFDAGLTRIHNNLETSRRFFPQICTTHTYDDKIAALRAARSAGMSLCSGGIFGLGETPEDRVDMAMTLRELGVKSVPINIFVAIPGSPLSRPTLKSLTSADAKRIVAVYRFILPDASIRLAGGRKLLEDKGFGCFHSGANATITGDMLTTSGIDILTDVSAVQSFGYELKLRNDR